MTPRDGAGEAPGGAGGRAVGGPDGPSARVATSLLLRRPGEVLLARKKRGFGAGLVVGPGGGLEPGETPLQAAVRECVEEISCRPLDARAVAELDFRFRDRPDWDLRVLVFVAERWEGVPTESDEVAPAWYRADAPPLDAMWPDARLWLPRVLAGERLRAACTYAGDPKAGAARVASFEVQAGPAPR